MKKEDGEKMETTVTAPPAATANGTPAKGNNYSFAEMLCLNLPCSLQRQMLLDQR